MLEYFSKSICLAETPTHANASDAKAFKNALTDRGIDSNRFVVGMHSPLHQTRAEVRAFLSNMLKNYKVNAVEVYNHKPCDPTNPENSAVYDKNTGGCLLSQGLNTWQQADEVATSLNFSIKEALVKGENKSVKIITDPNNGVDVEAIASFKYKDVDFRLSSKVTPVADALEEYSVWL